MLYKQFLSGIEAESILEWCQTKELKLYVFGYLACVYTLNDYDFKDPAIKDLLDKVIKCNSGLQIVPEQCYVFKLLPNGFFPIHTDSNIRTNILLRKPIDGGYIIDNNKKVDMDPTDAYILDARNPHGVATVKGDREYMSMIFSFTPEESKE